MIPESDALPMLAFLAEIDASDSVFWRCDGKYAPVTFWIICNDFFYWATSEGEEITTADIPAVRQAIQDASAATNIPKYWGLMLWAARKRGMRPQQPAYPKRLEDQGLRALFDACGPARDPKDEG